MRAIFQAFEDGNMDCGLACLTMLAGKGVEHWRDELGIRETRKTKKREILRLLRDVGFRKVEEGRLSGKKRLIDLQHDALIFGKVIENGKEFGHWAVWDSADQCLRDPNGYRAPFRATSFTALKRRKP